MATQAQVATRAVADGTPGTKVIRNSASYETTGRTWLSFIQHCEQETGSFSNLDGNGVPSGITSNIPGRVTGSQISKIYRTISVDSNVGTANLHLLSLNGVVFGSSAQFGPVGPFHASTADSIKLGDGVNN